MTLLPTCSTTLGTDTLDLRYSAPARELSGREVVIEGYLSHSHGPQPRWSLVDQHRRVPRLRRRCRRSRCRVRGRRCEQADEGAVRVRGRLDYGLRIDDGVASMLRIDRRDHRVDDGA